MDSVIDVIRVLSDMLYVLLRVGLVFGVILLGICALCVYEGIGGPHVFLSTRFDLT